MLASYKRAIEAKNIALYKSVQPNLSREEERHLTQSFKAFDSHLVEFANVNVTIQGNQATVALDRVDSFVVKGKQEKPVQKPPDAAAGERTGGVEDREEPVIAPSGY